MLESTYHRVTFQLNVQIVLINTANSERGTETKKSGYETLYIYLKSLLHFISVNWIYFPICVHSI